MEFLRNIWNKVTNNSPQTAADWYRRAQQTEAIEEQIFAYTQAIDLGYRPLAEAYFERGNSYESMELYQEAIQDFTTAIELEANNPQYYTNRGLSYYNLEMYHEAMQDYNQAIIIAPQEVIPYYNRGSCYAVMGQYDEAIADYTQAISLEPNNWELYEMRAKTYYLQDDNEAALKDINTIFANTQINNKEIYLLRACVHTNLQKYQHALSDFSQVNPIEDTFYLNCRGYVHFQLSNFQEAINDWESIKQIDALYDVPEDWNYIEAAKVNLEQVAAKTLFLMPTSYGNLLNFKEYNHLTDLVVNLLTKLYPNAPMDITELGMGTIYIDRGEDKLTLNLDNLIRKVAKQEIGGWQRIIELHFTALKDNTPAYTYLFKDYDYAKQFLKVLIKPDDIMPSDSLELYVYRVDFPSTITFLVLDFEEQLHYINKENAKKWEITTEELFEEAKQNILNEEMTVYEYGFANKFTVYSINNGDFAASFAIFFSEGTEGCIGKYGSLVAIPAKGTVLVHPIETNEVLELILLLEPIVTETFNNAPSNISSNYFWYDGKQFHLFPIANNKIRLPEKLLALY